MKSINEKEKKLTDALTRLNLLNPESSALRENIRIISVQKNQLEIEKKAIEEKYIKLKEEYNILNSKLEEISVKKTLDNKKEIEISEKIDELNQETDTLLEEIDKWQM